MASTVVLSAVVVTAVGWLLLQQTRDGLLDHRVGAVRGEAADESSRGRRRLGSRPRARTPTPRRSSSDADRPDHPARRTRGFGVRGGGSGR